MMTTRRLIRKSHCNVCGKRLSTKALTGAVLWQPSRVDDKGIYCVPCYKPKNGKEKQSGRA